MAKAYLLALEWDDREARVAVASARGNDVVVEEAFAVDLGTASAEDAALSAEEIGSRLAEVLAARGLTGADTLVALGRSNIELRLLSLPPAPPAEIPDMVRFQAMQAFTAIGEDWPLDFVELESHDEAVSVLAAVVSPRQVQHIQDVCAASDLKANSIVLRPFAAASLLGRSGLLDVQRAGLIVDLLADAVDLTAIAQGQVVFMRTIRLPTAADENSQARALVGEVRRTIGAAQNQLGGSRIEQIIVCGSDEEHAILRQALSESLALEVTSYDPFQNVRLGRELGKQLPPDLGRYAPLLGMLSDGVAGVPHAIDFLNPRRRPKPPSTVRRNVLIAATVLVVIAGVALAVWVKRNQLQNDIAELKTHTQAMEEVVKSARVMVAQADAVKEFLDGDITWLDEMREVALRLPDADHVILDELSVQADLARGGSMSLRGNVTTPDVIAEFEDSLRYGENTVIGRFGTIDRNRRDYPYTLDTTVVVVPDVQDKGRSLGRPLRDQILKEAHSATDSASPTPSKASVPAGESENDDGQPVDDDGPKAAATGGETS